MKTASLSVHDISRLPDRIRARVAWADGRPQQEYVLRWLNGILWAFVPDVVRDAAGIVYSKGDGSCHHDVELVN